MTRKANPKTVRQRAGTRATGGGDQEQVTKWLKSTGVRVRLRRGQRLASRIDRKETLYFVESGLLLLTAAVPGRARQILGLIYPGDVIRSSAFPALAEVSLIAASDGEAIRLPWSAPSDDEADKPAVSAFLHDRSADLQARLIQHIAKLGGMSGEQRLAALLIELANRFGQQGRQGTFFDLPLSRIDIADYLALNADTLSRIVSRLKTSGAVTWISRNRAVITDWEALRLRSGLHNPASGSSRDHKSRG